MNELDQKIQVEKIRLIYGQGAVLVFGSTFCAVMVTGFLWRSLPVSGLLFWLGVLTLTTVLRYMTIRAYQRASEQARQSPDWGRFFWLGTLVAGVIWGVLPLMFYSLYNTELLLLLSTIFAGMVAVSAASGGIYLPVFLSFSMPLIMPLSITHLISSSDSLRLTGGLLMMFLAVNYFMASRGNRQNEALLRAQFRNQELMVRLTEEKTIAERAVVAKSRFLAAASHDLRQPLHAMGLFLAALRRRESNPDQLSIIDEMSQSADALNGLFSSLLDVSRLDAEVIEFKPDHHRLDAMFNRVRATFIQQARSKGVELITDASPSVVHTDAILLERVLRNLVSNAVQYTSSGRIQLGCERDASGDFIITLTDTGMGIPVSAREEIFSEYYQLNNPERDRTKGLGLGLSIVQRLTSLMNMPLRMDSELGKGTTFTLLVPAGDESALQVVAPIEPSSEQSLREDCVVLVVDDERAVLHSMRTTLEDAGCTVLLAESARDALKVIALSNTVPHLVLSDYRLRHGENGVDCVAAVRESIDSEVPAVIITGDTSPDRLRELVASNLHVLHKPVAPVELQGLLERLVPSMHSAVA
jgi:signal transduction histidine kinase/CheY-like chemotaxis protein